MIPSFEQFTKDIKAIYPEGNMVEAYSRLKWHFAETTDFNNPDIYTIVLKKFRDHVESWKTKYGDREERYLSDSSRKELKNIYEFLGGYMWRMEFGGLTQSKSRDKYLFPAIPIPELMEMLNKFKDDQEKARP